MYIERFQHQPHSYMYMYVYYKYIHVLYTCMFDIPQQGDCKLVDLVM